jgi:hypothetical protein
MRIVRGFFGTLLMLVAGFLGAFAAFESGAHSGWGEFRIDRLFKRGLIWGAGFIVVGLLAMAVARTGNSMGKGLLGRVFAILAIGTTAHAVVVSNHNPMGSLVFAVPALIMAIVASVLLAGKTT